MTIVANNPEIDTLAALLALVAHSQIVVAEPKGEAAVKPCLLPDGFDDVDVAILEWIAAEGRRLDREFVRH